MAELVLNKIDVLDSSKEAGERPNSPALDRAETVLCYAKWTTTITKIRHVVKRPVQCLVRLLPAKHVLPNHTYPYVTHHQSYVAVVGLRSA